MNMNKLEVINDVISTLKELENDFLKKYNLSLNEILKQIEFAHDSTYFNDMLMLDRKNFIKAINKLIENNNLKKIAVYPCNSYIDKIMDIFEGYEFIICDDFRQGEYVNGHLIHSPEILNEKSFDLILIISYRDLVRDNLMKKLDSPKNVFWIYDVVKKYIEYDTNIFEKFLEKSFDDNKINNILRIIDTAKKPIVSINGFLFNNYSPTYRALKDNGYEPIIITRNSYLCYAKPESNISEFSIKNTFQLELVELFYLCSKLIDCPVVINDISFLIPSFDASKAKINFAFVLILLKSIKSKKFLYLYDVIHSVMKNHHETDVYFNLYKEVLNSSDGIICNSNTKEVHSSLRYALNIDKPMLSFYRYNEFVPNLKQKIDDGEFHLVIIGGMDDKLRDSTKMLKNILMQKIHVHNYVNNNAIKEFLEILSDEEKQYFHNHESIVSQHELIHEISQYHAGWIMDNGFEVLNMINSAERIDFKEMLMMFRLTTISSSLLAMGSAGLPMFLNKMVVHVTYQFPQEFFIAIEEPEVVNFRKMVYDIDWNGRYKVTQAKRELFSIDNNIHKLIDWIELNSEK